MIKMLREFSLGFAILFSIAVVIGILTILPGWADMVLFSLLACWLLGFMLLNQRVDGW